MTISSYDFEPFVWIEDSDGTWRSPQTTTATITTKKDTYGRTYWQATITFVPQSSNSAIGINITTQRNSKQGRYWWHQDVRPAPAKPIQTPIVVDPVPDQPSGAKREFMRYNIICSFNPGQPDLKIIVDARNILWIHDGRKWRRVTNIDYGQPHPTRPGIYCNASISLEGGGVIQTDLRPPR